MKYLVNENHSDAEFKLGKPRAGLKDLSDKVAASVTIANASSISESPDSLQISMSPSFFKEMTP
jgi:hypothetical protein